MWICGGKVIQAQGTAHKNPVFGGMLAMVEEMRRGHWDGSRVNKARETKDETQEAVEGQIMQGLVSQWKDSGFHSECDGSDWTDLRGGVT